MTVTVGDQGVRFTMESVAAYERSPFWWLRRFLYHLDHPDAACLCGRRDLQLHHLGYSRLGVERDEELLPLCADHHYEVEKHIGRSHLNRADATAEFVTAWEARRERSVADGLRQLDPLSGLGRPALALASVNQPGKEDQQ